MSFNLTVTCRLNIDYHLLDDSFDNFVDVDEYNELVDVDENHLVQEAVEKGADDDDVLIVMVLEVAIMVAVKAVLVIIVEFDDSADLNTPLVYCLLLLVLNIVAECICICDD